MIVSWNWLSDYVQRPDSVEEAGDLWTMSGLNLEGIETVGRAEGVRSDDFAVDLEVTSNRADCLGHIGVARELAVLCGRDGLDVPAADVPTTDGDARDHVAVDINCPDACTQYSARVVKGVKVGPSPEWMQDRLKAVGITPVNNIVDCTNYVMLECGQPLHAFDLSKLQGARILVRRAEPGEKFEAINHKTYELTPEDCVIADSTKPVALAGVMGGAETEIHDGTTDVLVEAAWFDPVTVRNTARRLVLFSDSSYRFERHVDEQQIDWASRRCCELIAQTAGGEVIGGSVVAGKTSGWDPEPISLRAGEVERLLGIVVEVAECEEILTKLGCEAVSTEGGTVTVKPPSWRRDLTREADLIEEVARIHGYDKIPTDTPLPVAVPLPTDEEFVTDRAADALVAAGFCEGLTLSFVSEQTMELFRPRPDLPPVRTTHTTRKNENILRPSIVPSLLLSRRENERKGSFDADLFEIARVFLRPDPDDAAAQPVMISGVTGRSFRELRGLMDVIAERCVGNVPVSVRPSDVAQFAPGRGAELTLAGEPWGWMGELSAEVAGGLGLAGSVYVFEVAMAPLAAHAKRVRVADDVPSFPAIVRDLNFVLDEATTWAELEATARSAAGELLEAIRFIDEYRGKQIAAGKKSYIIQLSYRDAARTLTGEEVDAAQEKVVSAVKGELNAEQR